MFMALEGDFDNRSRNSFRFGGQRRGNSGVGEEKGDPEAPGLWAHEKKHRAGEWQAPFSSELKRQKSQWLVF